MDNFSTNFGSTAENITEILRKFLKILNNLVELFRILMLGNNVTWKPQGHSRLILWKLWINILLRLWRNFENVSWNFNEILEKCEQPSYKFLSILMEILSIFMSVFGKIFEELWGKYAIIGIEIDIDTRESIDTGKYREVSILFPSLSPDFTPRII